MLEKDILFPLNVQHDCTRGERTCAATGTKAVIQEREITDRTYQVIEHVDDRHFVVNLNVLHHANLISKFFHPEIQKRTHFDRCRLHEELTAQLRMEGQGDNKHGDDGDDDDGVGSDVAQGDQADDEQTQIAQEFARVEEDDDIDDLGDALTEIHAMEEEELD